MEKKIIKKCAVYFDYKIGFELKHLLYMVLYTFYKKWYFNQTYHNFIFYI